MSEKVRVPVGKKFGELTILGRAPNPTNCGGCHVFVRCDCGSEQRMTLRSIVRRGVSRCSKASHWDREIIEKGNSLAGKRYGALVVLSGTAIRGETGKSQALVRCDCGAERFVIVNHLLRGNVASCGGEAHKTIKPQAHRWKWSGKSGTYAIEAVGLNLIKIGSARDIKERLQKLQYPCPVELRLIAWSDENIEGRMHALLAEHRAHGEWFRKTLDVVEQIQTLLEPRNLSVLAEIGVGSRGKTRGKKHKCSRCGDLGHHSKTCARPMLEQHNHAVESAP